MLLITGPSASGKTTLGKQLVDQLGYTQLDGDVVWNELKKSGRLGFQGKTIHWNEIHSDLMLRAYSLSRKSRVVLTHVVLPDTIPKYVEFFQDLGVQFNIEVLMASKKELMNRSQSRPTFNRPTPPYVINTMHDLFADYLTTM